MSAQSSRHQTIFADEETSMVKVGVVGCGRIGMLHIEALTKAPGVLPIICSNPTIERARKAAEKFKLKEYCADADDVITHPEVEAVWICSPSQFHAEQIIACAKHGKHVFCEKPIATDLQQTILAIDACRAAGVKLMIGLQRRFDKNFARVKKSMEDKEVGEPFLVCTIPIVTPTYTRINFCRAHFVFCSLSRFNFCIADQAHVS
jgi:predicted dehydrogenase